MDMVLANETLRDGDTSHLTREEFIALVRTATGSDIRARRWAAKRAAAQMARGETTR